MRNGTSRVVCTRRIAAVTRIDGLNDGLSVRSIVGSYNGRRHCILFRKYSRRESECVKICSFGDGSILENYQKTCIIDPLDLEAAVGILPFSKGGLNVSGLELFRKARKSQDASNAGGKLRE